MSPEHLLFLKRLKRRKTSVKIAQVGLLVIAVCLWEILALFNVIDPFIMSSPSRVVKTIVELFSQGLLRHIGITLFETLVGFLIATTLGTFFGFLMWYFDFIKEVAEPYLVVLNALPKIALGPILIVWCGIGYTPIIAMTVLICIIITNISTLAAFSETDSDKIMLMKAMGAKKGRIFLTLVLPSSLPAIMSMLKINVGLSFVGSIMGEYLVSREGLGYLIVYGGQVFKLDLVMASTVILLLLSGVVYFAVSLLERLTIRYK